MLHNNQEKTPIHPPKPPTNSTYPKPSLRLIEPNGTSWKAMEGYEMFQNPKEPHRTRWKVIESPGIWWKTLKNPGMF